MGRIGGIAAAWLLGGCGAKQACLDVTRAYGAGEPSTLSARDGTCLQGVAWTPAEPKGVVVVVHGIRDHAMRYEGLADALVDHGYAVSAHDLRGHGTSGGRRQRFDTMDALVADVDLGVAEAVAAHPGLPVFLYGHSLGGLVATHYALQHPDAIDGLVLSGAAVALPVGVTGGQRFAARLFGTILPNLPAQPVDDTLFVSTPEANAAFMADPLISHDNLPARSAKATLNGIRDVESRYAALSLPMLVMHAGNDEVTSVEGSRALVAAAASTDETLKIWEGQAHDLMHEPRADEVVDAVVAWLDAHVR